MSQPKSLILKRPKKIGLTKFIELTNEAQDVETLYYLLEEALDFECGYDRVIFSLMSDHSNLGLKAGHGVMRNYPDDWMRYYIEKGYEHVDPVRRFGFRHVGPFIWDSLPVVLDLTPQQGVCMNECKEAGFYNGAAVCLRGATGGLGGIGVAMSGQKKTDNDREAKRKLSLLNVISQQFYAAFCDLHEKKRQFEIQQVILTNRELEILQHMAMGRKDDVIAFNLSLTKHAVNFHARNILKKFDASNRLSAVLKALSNGIITLDDTAFVRRISAH